MRYTWTMLSPSIRRFIAAIAPPIFVQAIKRRDHLPATESREISVNVHGATLMLPRAHNLPHYVARYPFYDSALPALAAFLRHHKTSPLAVIDVGANLGDTAAIIAASIGNEAAEFICVEADEQYLPLLRLNTAQLNVQIVHAIAGHISGSAHAAALPSGIGSSVIVSDDNSTARMVAVDDLTDSPVDLLKIDTDGFELEVLRGSARTLRQDNITIFLEYSPPHIRRYGGTEPSDVLGSLRQAGFEEVMVYDNVGIPIGIFPCVGDVLTAMSSYSERRADFYLDLLLNRDGQQLRKFLALEIDRTRSSALHF
ncbi:MAG TPA: FkbM family methyltransferase [Xanthobacteraceae bacterium]|nr:FkbM family methyltransferase [Xanthobacteraceae bacterium]